MGVGVSSLSVRVRRQWNVDLLLLQDSSEPVMTVKDITRRLEQLDAALRLVETEGRDLEEKIRKGITTVILWWCPFTLRSAHERPLHRHCRSVIVFRQDDLCKTKPRRAVEARAAMCNGLVIVTEVCMLLTVIEYKCLTFCYAAHFNE